MTYFSGFETKRVFSIWHDCDVEKSPHCLTAVTPFCKVGGEEGLTEASGSATKRRKIFPNYSPPLQKGAAAIRGGGIFLHRGEAAPGLTPQHLIDIVKL